MPILILYMLVLLVTKSAFSNIHYENLPNVQQKKGILM